MVTIFTPIHKLNDVFIKDISVSLDYQTHSDFEWLICINGEADEKTLRSKIEYYAIDLLKKTRFITHPSTKNVGMLKAYCCENANGDILIELDYDDYLSHDAIAEIVKAFADEDVKFSYSNAIEFIYPTPQEGPKYNKYGEQYGWRYRTTENGETEMIAFPESVQYMRRIEWCPNHVRAFRKDAYKKVGGYSKEKALGDDHDIVCRFYKQYGQKGFKHIDKPLYHYRVHQDNTCNGNNRNAEVQAMVDINFKEHSEAMWMKWANDNGLKCYDLGGAFNSPSGYISVDNRIYADVVADLSRKWTFAEDNSAGVLRAYHILEHIDDVYHLNEHGEIAPKYNGEIHFFNEAYRTLAPGGMLIIQVPSIRGDGAVSDPTHKKFFNKRSFRYYSDEELAQYIRPEYTGRFQMARIHEYYWKGTETAVIDVHLIALKGWYDERWCGEKLC